MSSAARVDPFASLEDFKPAARPKPEAETIRKVSEDNNFVSRAPAGPVKQPEAQPTPKAEQRRYRSGRNTQVNIKTTPETLQLLTRLSDAQGWVYGETLAKALAALEEKLAVR